MDRERILITVRTYPTISSRHLETVCTGGINDKGEWRRLVPVPLRYLEAYRQYKTFDVVQVSLQPGHDGRPETRTPHLPSLRRIEHLSSWQARHDWVNPTTFPSLPDLQDAGRTLGPVAVKRVFGIQARRTAPQWTALQETKLRQANLFDERKPLEKLPYQFHVEWEDTKGHEHRSLVLAWEMLETYRRYRQRYNDPIEKMKEKWLGGLFAQHRRLSFFMGNLANRRQVFCICGWFAPPLKEIEHGLF